MPGTGSGASSGAKGTTRPPFPAAPLLVFAPLAAGVALAGFASYRAHGAEHRAQARERWPRLTSGEAAPARLGAGPGSGMDLFERVRQPVPDGLLRREGRAT
ncbi:MAG TPA: hypothetical protein VIV59_11220 [Anaeromyxobacteraceae bacterium]